MPHKLQRSNAAALEGENRQPGTPSVRKRTAPPKGGAFWLSGQPRTPNLLRLPYKPQRSNAATLQRLASDLFGCSSKPLQPEPPCMSSRVTNLLENGGVRGKTLFCFPPAALRRFRRAKAASALQGKTVSLAPPQSASGELPPKGEPFGCREPPVPSTSRGCRTSNKGAMRRLCRGLLPTGPLSSQADGSPQGGAFGLCFYRMKFVQAWGSFSGRP